MQKINKTGAMPNSTAKEFEKYKGRSWSEIPESVKTPLREQLLTEQKGLCCYCCRSIENKSTHIEHLQSRKHYPAKWSDYNNLLLSCNTAQQCDNAKGNQQLPLHPLMDDCDVEIKMNLAGELESNSHRAEASLNILNLNNRKICAFRKALVDTMIFNFDVSNPYKRPFEIRDQETLILLLDDLPIVQKNELEYIINKLT